MRLFTKSVDHLIRVHLNGHHLANESNPLLEVLHQTVHISHTITPTNTEDQRLRHSTANYGLVVETLQE